MENKKIDAACIGYSEASVPCERELQDLGEYSACTVVAYDVSVDDDGELTGTMLISFGHDYGDGRKVRPEFAAKLAEIVNDVIDRQDGSDGCEKCEFKEECCEYPDVSDADRESIRKELDQLIEESEELLKALKKISK